MSHRENIYLEQLAMQMRIVETELELLTDLLEKARVELYRGRGVHKDDEGAATTNTGEKEEWVPENPELPF